MAEVADVCSSAPMQALLAREMADLAPILSGAYGNYGLILRPRHAGGTLPPHLLGTIAALHVDERGMFAGSVQCAPWQLPFASESFKVLIAQHALERIADAAACVAELSRVLAPEGIALVFGFNPYGSWRPWLLRRANDLHLCSAQTCSAQFAHERIDTLQVRFPGLMWPCAQAPADTRSAPASRFARFGSSWLLIACKRRSALTPIRLRSGARDPGRAPQLAPGAHRNVA